MKRYHRPFLALLLSLLLIGSQQAAFAHLLSHVPAGSAVVTQIRGDHSGIDKLADTCVTCVAFAGVGGGTPPSASTVSFTVFSGDSYLLPFARPVFTRSVITSRARAPPVSL